MTISYSGNFAKLLLRWKGSIWKTVWKELLAYLMLYYTVRLIYRFALTTTTSKELFEDLIIEFDSYTTRIPIMFLLGFYVAAVVKRWWEQFEWLIWPDDVLSMLCYIMPKNDEDSKIRRRAIARYLNLTAALAWREISVKVRKRFPSKEHLIKAGLLTEDELVIYHSTPVSSRWFVSLQWAQKLVQEYCDINQVPAPLVTQFLDLLYKYKLGFRQLHCYDWVCIPLVYTQVAAIATYGYFGLCLIGRQFVDRTNRTESTSTCNGSCVDYYVPLFTILEFLFYIGWFKVGQDLMRPFEEDDDDFELNYILDRNIHVSSAMVNNLHTIMPPLKDHPSWQTADTIIPHTLISSHLQYHPPKLHAFVTLKTEKDAQMTTENLFDEPTIQRRDHWRKKTILGRKKRLRYF